MKGLGEIYQRDIGNKHSMAVEHIAYILFELAILVVFIDQKDYVQLLNSLALHDWMQCTLNRTISVWNLQ